jgi:hypothetical protein
MINTLFSLILLGLEPNEAQIQAWVQRYAPIVVADSQEMAPLTSVDAILATQPSLQGTCPDGSRRSQVIRAAEDLQAPAAQELMQSCAQELALHFNRQIPPAQNTAYYHVLVEPLYVKIQYWFFYTWNETGHLGGGPLIASCGDHEGDWEHISLRLDRERLEQARTPAEFRNALDDIYLAGHARSQHRQKKYLRPDHPLLRFEDSHLLVFSSRGNHASYPAPGRWPLMTLAGLALADLNDGQGQRFELSQGQLLPVMAQPWFHFAGRWGAMVYDHCDPVEAITEASNDGSFGPGHAHKHKVLYQGDWFDHFRPRWQRP